MAQRVPARITVYDEATGTIVGQATSLGYVGMQVFPVAPGPRQYLIRTESAGGNEDGRLQSRSFGARTLIATTFRR